MEKKIFGIDLGTSNTSLSRFEQGKPIAIEIQQDFDQSSEGKALTLPSVIQDSR